MTTTLLGPQTCAQQAAWMHGSSFVITVLWLGM